MPEEIEIICTTEELTDFADAGHRTFAANFSVGMKGSAAPLQPLSIALLQPWRWKLTGMALHCQISATDPAQTPTVPPVATLMGNPTLSGAALPTLQTRLATQFQTVLAATSNTQPLFAWDPANPAATAPPVLDTFGNPIQRWPVFLGHASTYPAALPQNLNLVVFFQVQTSSLSGVVRLLVAPVFQIDLNGTTISYSSPSKTPVAPPPISGTPADAQQGYRWDYEAAPGDTSGCILATHQEGLLLDPFPFPATAAVGPGQLDLDGLWIKPEEEFGNEDWRTSLELRAAETFDLGRLLIGVLRDPIAPAGTTAPTLATVFGAPPPTYADVEALRQTVLAVLRDTADYGLRYAPDGSTLFRFVLHQMDGPDGFDLDAFLGQAEATLQLEEAKVTLADKGQYDWQTSIAGLPGVDALASISVAATGNPPYGDKDFANLLRALAAVQKALALDSNLALLLYQAWDAALSLSTAPPGWAAIRSSVQTTLNALAQANGLRKRMLLGNMGGADASLATWQQLIHLSGPGQDTDQVRANLSAAPLAYFQSRFHAPNAGADFQARLPKLPANLSAHAISFLQTGVAAAGTSAAAILPASNASIQPSPSVHPLVLRVHTPANDADDPLRGIAGVCLLLRPHADPRNPALPRKPWSCLNVAQLNIVDPAHPVQNPDGTTSPGSVMAEDVTFVPSRLITRNGIQQAALSYNNRPLAAPSPAEGLASALARNADNQYVPLFGYSHVAKTTTLGASSTIGAWAYMSGLKYGWWYDTIAFAVRNSGALPKLLADLGAANSTTGSATVLPTAPLVPLSPDAFAAVARANMMTPVQYLRRTPVGQVRTKVAGKITDLNQQSLPVIPDTVAPLAHELPQIGPAGGKLPLLMLWDTPDSSKKSYSFDLRPPATDPHVFDRWIDSFDAQDKLRVTRAAVAADYALKAPKQVNDSSPVDTSINDTSINDPAVSHLCLQLTALYPAGAAAVTSRCIPVAPLAALAVADFVKGNGFAQVQRVLSTVTITKDKSASASMSVTEAPLLDSSGHPVVNPDGTAVFRYLVAVTVPEGQVWKISIAPAITPGLEDSFDKVATQSQFAGGAASDFTNPDSAQGMPATTTTSLNPSSTSLDMLIECAQPCSLTAEDLWRAMWFGKAGTISNEVALSLQPVSGSDWHLLRRIEVARQAWRWMGRPFFLDQSFPTTAITDLNAIQTVSPAENDPAPNLATALNWEIQAFAERNYDATLTSSRVFFPPATATPPEQKIYTQDLASDLRAHYFRFGTRMYSRYEGLPGFSPFTNSTAQSIAAKIDFRPTTTANETRPGGFTTWARAFVPCRLTADFSLPKPKILLCLPLTAATTLPNGDPTSQTSLLVIADEPWHQIGGLAEQLVATIEEVVLQQAGGDLHALQIGPDPILSTTPYLPSYSVSTNPSDAPGTIAQADWIGKPIGTTFDDASTAPLLANTCFQFSFAELNLPPNLPSQQPLDWYMAKMRFKRQLDPNMEVNKGTIASLPTDGAWVQFLPSSNHFTESDLKTTVDVTSLQLSWTNNKPQFLDAQGKSISLVAGPVTGTPTKNLRLWALLMGTITDAAGRPGEVYVDLYDFNAPSSIPNFAQVDSAYLIEVQSVPSPTAPDARSWLNQMVQIDKPGDEPDITKEAQYRALRISGAVKRL